MRTGHPAHLSGASVAIRNTQELPDRLYEQELAHHRRRSLPQDPSPVAGCADRRGQPIHGEKSCSMLYSIVKPNNYQDSLRLMRLSNLVTDTDGVNRVSIMMGTPMNKDILRNAGLANAEVDEAKPTDLLIMADVISAEVGESLVATVDAFLSDQASVSARSRLRTTRSLERASSIVGDANLAIVSIPGEYVAAEVERLLDHGTARLHLQRQREYRRRGGAQAEGSRARAARDGTRLRDREYRWVAAGVHERGPSGENRLGWRVGHRTARGHGTDRRG